MPAYPLPQAFVETREPDYNAYTPQEVQVRTPVRVAAQHAPTPPRQAEIAPVKPAYQPIAFFYHLVFRGGALNNRWRFNGSHMVIERLGQSGIPRGRMTTPMFGKRPNRRRDISSYGSQQPTV